jgi:hypothetical protein
LRKVGYDGATVRRLLGISGREIGARERSLLRRRVHGELNVPVSLFLLGDAVRSDALALLEAEASQGCS